MKEQNKRIQKNERHWFILSVIFLVALVVSNMSWLIYESQYDIEFEGQTQTVDSTDLDTSSIIQY
jgi:hypothetical protein